MQTDSLELSFLSIFSLISFFTFFIIQKYSHKIYKESIFDDDFEKPQSFHETKTPRSGGLASILSIVIFVFLYDKLFSYFYADYLVIGLGLFLIGFLEDIKIKSSPKKRLILMIIFLFLSIQLFSLDIFYIDIKFLSELLTIKIFLNIFVLLCFLFIINGSNLIDGFNGLLALQLIIINSVLLYVNLENNNTELIVLLISQIIILLTFLLFNFPLAKMFMGDSGAYLFGAVTSLNVIYTNNLNSNVSSFFYCILLFYLFFEVFFSFFRKIYMKKSPLRPDHLHLHMLLYKILKIKMNFKNSNSLNSFIINASYSILVLPSILFMENGIFCKYWFFSLLILYLIAYYRLFSFIKNKFNI